MHENARVGIGLQRRNLGSAAQYWKKLILPFFQPCNIYCNMEFSTYDLNKNTLYSHTNSNVKNEPLGTFNKLTFKLVGASFYALLYLWSPNRRALKALKAASIFTHWTLQLKTTVFPLWHHWKLPLASCPSKHQLCSELGLTPRANGVKTMVLLCCQWLHIFNLCFIVTLSSTDVFLLTFSFLLLFSSFMSFFKVS